MSRRKNTTVTVDDTVTENVDNTDNIVNETTETTVISDSSNDSNNNVSSLEDTQTFVIKSTVDRDKIVGLNGEVIQFDDDNCATVSREQAQYLLNCKNYTLKK